MMSEPIAGSRERAVKPDTKLPYTVLATNEQTSQEVGDSWGPSPSTAAPFNDAPIAWPKEVIEDCGLVQFDMVTVGQNGGEKSEGLKTEHMNESLKADRARDNMQVEGDKETTSLKY